jgi:hypothetical protein
MGGQVSVTKEADLPYLERDFDRHGNRRVYVRRSFKRIRLLQEEGTPEFATEYTVAVQKLGPGPVKIPNKALTGHPVNTFGWLGAEYFSNRRAISLSCPKTAGAPAATISRSASRCRSAARILNRSATARSNTSRRRRSGA